MSKCSVLCVAIYLTSLTSVVMICLFICHFICSVPVRHLSFSFPSPHLLLLSTSGTAQGVFFSFFYMHVRKDSLLFWHGYYSNYTTKRDRPFFSLEGIERSLGVFPSGRSKQSTSISQQQSFERPLRKSKSFLSVLAIKIKRRKPSFNVTNFPIVSFSSDVSQTAAALSGWRGVK